MTRKLSPLDDISQFRKNPETMMAYQRGERLAADGKYLAAIESFEKILIAFPNSPQILFRLAKLAVQLEMYEQAESFYTVLGQILPGDPSVASSYGILLRRMERQQEAVEVYKAAIQAYPKESLLWMNLGAVMSDLGDLGNATTFYLEAIRLNPKNRDARANLAMIYIQRGQPARAVEEYGRLRGYLKKSPYHRYNCAIAMLTIGDLKNGWNYYDARQDPTVNNAVIFEHKFEEWKGQDLNGKTLLVSGERGLGDQVMFLNCIADLAARAKRVILEIEPRLCSMVQRSYPQIDVIPYLSQWKFGRLHIRYDWLPADHGIDLWAPIGSVFKYLRPDLASFPAAGTQLTVNPELREKWRARVAENGPGPHVGLFRRSGLMTAVRRHGYPLWYAWAPIFKHRDIQFYDLHYDDDLNERLTVKEKFDIDLIYFDDLDYRNDLENALALLSCMDVVISPASSVQWFATALGIPTIGIITGPLWTMLGASVSPMQPSLYPILQYQDKSEPLGPKIASMMENLLGRDDGAGSGENHGNA